MKVRTPLGLFVAIVGVGLVPAAGVGSAIGISLKDYEPKPAVSPSGEVWENLGERATEPQSRVVSDEPTKRAPTKVKPTSVSVYKTPHARRSTADVQDEVEAPKARVEPEETETPDDRPTAAPTYTPPEEPTKPTKPAESTKGSDKRTPGADSPSD